MDGGYRSVEPRTLPGKGRLRKALLSTVFILACGGVATWILIPPTPKTAVINPSPVPAYITQKVNLPVYYPDQSQLPAGYIFDVSSIKSPLAQGVTYTVSYGQGQKLVFSLQPKPSDNELDSFVANYIPLNNDIQTKLGQAKLGAYSSKGVTQTMVSLPTLGKTWIIVTGPYNTDQNNLKQVLNSLRT